MDRRQEERPEGEGDDRRGFPRPPMMLNVILLAIGVVLGLVAYFHNRTMEKRFHQIVVRGSSTPEEIRQIRNDLSKKDLQGEALREVLKSRLEAVKSRKSDHFYLSIDTEKKQFGLYLGTDLVREAPVQIGAPANLKTENGAWSFPALKGSFAVKAKYEGLNWRIQPWVYAMSNQPVPAELPRVKNALGHYVIELPNNYIIHSPPSPESPLKGPKPGSFMVPEEILHAIWPRIHDGMRVYIF